MRQNEYLWSKGSKMDMSQAESKIMFVCPRPPDPQFTPRLKKLYCVFAGEKYFYRLPPKRPIACQESGFNHTC